MQKIFLYIICIALFPANLWAASCSHANLTRCLDSACAIGMNSNPAARCQYCGTSSAGEPASDNGMRSVSVGASAKYNLTDKELKKAPTDPGSRYAWATAQCIKKVSGCTADDVTDVYDELIEQSCKAAGIESQFSALHEESKKTVSESSCSNTIRKCINDNTRCASNWGNCHEDSDFDKYFSECGIEARGCDIYMAQIRNTLIKSRDTVVANADALIDSIAKGYQSARENKLTRIKSSCTDNSGYDACISSVCAQNMPNNCKNGNAEDKAEKSMATQLCKFYEIACAVLK